jgi:hypothetical protein
MRIKRADKLRASCGMQTYIPEARSRYALILMSPRRDRVSH